MLNYLEIFVVITLEDSKKQREIQVSVEKNRASSMRNRSRNVERINCRTHGSGEDTFQFTSAPEAISIRAISAFIPFIAADL